MVLIWQLILSSRNGYDSAPQRALPESSIAVSYSISDERSRRETNGGDNVTYSCNDMLASLRIVPSSFNRKSPTKVYSRSTYTKIRRYFGAFGAFRECIWCPTTVKKESGGTWNAIIDTPTYLPLLWPMSNTIALYPLSNFTFRQVAIIWSFTCLTLE